LIVVVAIEEGRGLAYAIKIKKNKKNKKRINLSCWAAEPPPTAMRSLWMLAIE
jgi:hypothetical protein